MLKNEAENGKIAVRNIRKDINNHLKKLEKDKENPISEDELKKEEATVQTLTDKYVKEIDDLFTSKGGMGQNSYIPLRLNTAGVMPVIFASVFMLIPGVIVNALPSTLSIKTTLSIIFGQNHPVYMILYALVIMFFSFFYTALVFDPEKVAENLKQGGGTIPGIRPGEENC